MSEEEQTPVDATDAEATEANPAAHMPPPVDFRLFLHGYVGQTMIALGKMPHPITGETKTELPWARYFIDLLGMLEDKTQGNLDKEEQAFLDSQLQTLRLTYVETAKDEGGEEA